MNVCMVGTGYVGLVAGTCLSDFGMNVTCIDKDKDKIKALNRGDLPIYELGLIELIQRNVKLKRLHFSTDLKEAVDSSLVIFLAVGTPEGSDGRPVLDQLYEVVADTARHMNDYKIIAIKSTVPIGTAAEVSRIIRENLKSEVGFDVVSNPEFLREGAAVNDFLHPDRIVLGCDSEKALAIMRDIYRPLYLLETPIISTTSATAELIKYAANTMLAVRISFMNEIANLCDRVGADVYQVGVALGKDGRIGPKFLHPGPGFGGSCFPKDINALVHQADDAGYDFKMARAVIEVNDRQREIIVEKSRKMLGSFDDKNICLLGLAFKPNTDDVREAPAIHIARRFIDQGARVKAFDPAAMDQAQKALNGKGIEYCRDAYQASQDADLIVICTEWNEFRDLDLKRILKLVRKPNLFDTRNIYNPKTVREIGFTYISTGRP